jgi:hypothetical protein
LRQASQGSGSEAMLSIYVSRRPARPAHAAARRGIQRAVSWLNSTGHEEHTAMHGVMAHSDMTGPHTGDPGGATHDCQGPGPRPRARGLQRRAADPARQAHR